MGFKGGGVQRVGEGGLKIVWIKGSGVKGSGDRRLGVKGACITYLPSCMLK